MPNVFRILLSVIVVIGIVLAGVWISTQPRTWTSAEIKTLQSLWIGSLPPVPDDGSNAVANNPQAASFGYQLFFDTRLSGNENVSCATCHRPERFFTDDLKVAQGNKAGIRNTMSIIGAAYSPWMFWDGRKDSLWSQALSPLESPIEHAGSRMQYALLVSRDENYRALYETLYEPFPDLSDSSRFPTVARLASGQAGSVGIKEWNSAWQLMSPENKNVVTKVFVNIAKSIAAYERLLLPGASRFDLYVEGVMENNSEKMSALTRDEVAGLGLFIGKAQCINCHNGPLFTNNEFHNTGVLSPPGQLPGLGRVSAVRVVRADTFNCLGSFSDAASKECAELRFTRTGDETVGAHKVPSLRNVAETGPYMHAGQLNRLDEVVEHYNRAPPAMIGHNEIKSLNLNPVEMQQLEAFLHSLSAPPATDPKWLTRPQSHH